MDNRNVRSGDPIPVSNYSDQPYVVKTDDGGWLMVVTTGAGTEGSKGQHITSVSAGLRRIAGKSGILLCGALQNELWQSVLFL